MRPSAASSPSDAVPMAAGFAEDVAYYLTQTPRQLPSRYLYDELGSSLFEAICRLPEYTITRTEQALLRAHAGDVFRAMRPASRIVELGPGSGEKLVTLLASRDRPSVSVHLIDISAAALVKATAALAGSAVTIVTHEATYEAGLAQIRDQDASGATLVAFLGSNIGNFDPPGVEAFLRGVRAVVRPGDALLLGTDLVKPEAELVRAYDDALGVTAAFNRNLLVRINRELGGNFDVSQFAHQATWNAPLSRIEMHLVSRRRQRVVVRAVGLDITFEAGERIWTESSYKYRREDVSALLAHAGLHAIGQWAQDGFALTLAEAR